MAQSDQHRPSSVAMALLRTTEAPAGVERLKAEYGIEASLYGDDTDPGVYVTDPDQGEVLVRQCVARRNLAETI